MDHSNDDKDVASLFTNNAIALFIDADLFKDYSTCLEKNLSGGKQYSSHPVRSLHTIKIKFLLVA